MLTSSRRLSRCRAYVFTSQYRSSSIRRSSLIPKLWATSSRTARLTSRLSVSGLCPVSTFDICARRSDGSESSASRAYSSKPPSRIEKTAFQVENVDRRACRALGLKARRCCVQLARPRVIETGAGYRPSLVWRRMPPAPSTLAGVDVTFEVSGDLLTLPEGQATILAEKLRLFAAGQFRDDVQKLEELGTSRAWLAGTREAADLIEMALVDERSGPVPLVRGDVAEAVSQVLRISYVDASARAGAAGLVEALQALSEPDG
jgi:hypothetical protein